MARRLRTTGRERCHTRSPWGVSSAIWRGDLLSHVHAEESGPHHVEEEEEGEDCAQHVGWLFLVARHPFSEHQNNHILFDPIPHYVTAPPTQPLKKDR